MKLGLILLGYGMVALSVCAPFIFKTQKHDIYEVFTYPALLAVFLVWAWVHAKAAKNYFLNCTPVIKKKLIFAVFVGVMVSALIFVTVPKTQKTNSDEACILSTAQSLFYFHQPYNITEAKFYFDSLHPLNKEIPARPSGASLLFSLGQFLGLSAFASALLMQFLFSSLFFAGVSWGFSIPVVFLLLSNSVIASHINSAGFDFISAVIELWIFVLMINRKKINHELLVSLLFSSLAVFSHIRYENSFLAVFVLLWFFKSSIKNAWMVFLGFALSIHFWQRAVGPHTFSTGDFFDHLKHLIHAPWVEFSPVNGILMAIGLVAMLVIAFRDVLIRPVIMYIFLQLVFFLFLVAGLADHPSTARYFLPLIMVATLSTAYLFRTYKKILLLASVFSFVWYYPAAMHSDFYDTLTLNRDLQILFPFVESQKTKRLVVLFDRPVEFTARGYGALSIARAKEEFLNLKQELQNGLYDHVYLFEETTYSTVLNSWSMTEPCFHELKRYQQYGDHLMIISEMNCAQSANANLHSSVEARPSGQSKVQKPKRESELPVVRYKGAK